MNMTKFSPDIPMPSLPETAGPPAGVPPSAGTFSSPSTAAIDTRVPPIARRSRLARRISVFLTQDEAGRTLGHSGTWLSREAKRHELYKPTVGGGQQGAVCMYHPDHINHIINYLINKDLITEDEALRSWNKRRQEIASEMLASLRPSAPIQRGRARK